MLFRSPYWPALLGALLIGTLSGTLVELGVIRRLFRAPRVIVLVATIGVAELCQAITRSLPDYRTGTLQTAYPSPIRGEWHPGAGITVRGAQVLALIVVPLITLGLWWLLGHTKFGESVRASVANTDLARLTDLARARRIPLTDLRGGTFTISNYGAIGGIFATPMLHLPEVAILGVGKLLQKPVVHGGEVVIRTILPLSLTFDHRALDGAEAQRFLNELIAYLSNPARLVLVL